MKLSKNFDSREFECSCCRKSEITPQLVANLQVLRDLVGKPLVVTSGYRCLKHNRQIGSGDTSQHVKGNAADIHPTQGITLRELYEAAEKVPGFAGGGIGVYPYSGFIHVDVRGYMARWTQRRDKTLVSGIRKEEFR